MKKGKNILIGIPEEKEKGTEVIFKTTMGKKSLNLQGEMEIYIQDIQRIPNTVNPNKTTMTHIIIKMLKAKCK